MLYLYMAGKSVQNISLNFLRIRKQSVSDVNALFSLEDKSELERWSKNFASVTERSYMRGYRDIYKDVSTTHKLMIRFCDSLVKMKIIKIVFRSDNQNEKDI